MQTMKNNLNAIRRILCGTTAFLIDDVNFIGDSVRLSGWALLGTEDPDAFAFTVNGRRVPDQKLGLSSPSLSKVFPFIPSSSTSAFTLTTAIESGDLERGLLEVSLTDSLFLEPTNPWHTAYVPVNDLGFRIPDADQLQRTQGNISKSRYLTYGFSTANRIQRILRTYFQRSASDFESILDWGVGCGRVAQHLFSAPRNFLGCDIDAENVEWCQKNLEGKYFTNDLSPPLPLDEGSVDLVYGISVFTHLSEESAKAWRDELARVVRQGGVAIITVHGTTGIGRILDDARLVALAYDGFDASMGDRRLDGKISSRDYYRATFQSPRNVREFFGECFDVIDIISGANALLQDFVVLRRK